MHFEQHYTNHLVKSEDLNHHKTLYAGRCSEWFVESGFIAVAHQLDPEYIVCLNMHGIEFLNPVRGGHIVTFSSQIVRTGRSTLTIFIEVRDCRKNNVVTARGFITFCYVDEDTKPRAHGLTFEPETETEKELNRIASELNKKH